MLEQDPGNFAIPSHRRGDHVVGLDVDIGGQRPPQDWKQGKKRPFHAARISRIPVGDKAGIRGIQKSVGTEGPFLSKIPGKHIRTEPRKRRYVVATGEARGK